MRKELEELQRILRDKVVATEYDPIEHRWGVTRPRPISVPVVGDKVKMVEEGASQLTELTVEKLGLDTLVLKPDHFGTQYYEEIYNKGCDYVILTNDLQGRGHAVFIDMKGDIYNKPDKTGLLVTNEKRDASCGLQFCSAVALIRHLGQMVDVVSKCARLRDSYRHHYWVLFHKYLNSCGVQGLPTMIAGDAVCREVVAFRRSNLYGKIYTKLVKNKDVI